jgi:hypothetical protein
VTRFLPCFQPYQNTIYKQSLVPAFLPHSYKDGHPADYHLSLRTITLALAPSSTNSNSHLEVGHTGELWVSLLEKAYAKVHGSFFSLDSGSIADALVDLTGGVVTKVRLDTEDGEILVDTGALWSRLMLYCSWGFVIAAVHKVKPAAENASGPGGLLLNHIYCVIDCRLLSDGARIVRLHNPWPAGHWHGAWSYNSREWKNSGAA